MLKTSILSIGNEILIGQILNTNSKWIAEKTTALGCSIKKISSIGDSKDEIVSELDSLLQISDLLIITGGLGPTHDDITKQVLCEYFGDALVEDPTWLKKIETQLANRGIKLSERNREQALVPKKAKVLYNEIGTAPGMLFSYQNKTIISLPGVPQEVYCIMNDEVLSIIQNLVQSNSKDVILYKNIQTYGIAESNLADLLEIDMNFLGKSNLAFLPSFSGVKLRIGAFGKNQVEAQTELERIQTHIFSRAKEFIVSENEKSYSEILGALLKENNQTLAVAESCTAGMLGAELTKISGASNYFMGGMLTYSNEVKIKNLGVSNEIIKKYGVVSIECAEEMSKCAREKFQTDFGIAITGIAGPNGGTPEKPVGTVCFAVADKQNNIITERKILGNSRDIIRERSVQNAIMMLINLLRKDK